MILGTKLALDRMIPRDRGHIVNISSQAGKFGAPGGATYSATKHAVVGLTEAVRGELRLMGAHIDVSYVMPAVVNTELGSGLGAVRGIPNLEPTEVADAIVEALQTGRIDVWVPKRAKRTSARVLAAAAPALGGDGAGDQGRSRARGRRRERRASSTTCAHRARSRASSRRPRSPS